MASFESKTYSKRLLQLVSWSHWFTFFNIIAAILLSSIYVFSESMPDTLLGQTYLVTTWLSHMAFLTFISFVLILFPITILFPRTRFIRVVASIIFTIELLLLLLDAFIYSRLGYHLNISSSAPILELISNEIQQNSRAFWFISLVLTMLILSFELITSNYAWKHLKELQKTIFARFIVIPLVSFFFFSHIIHIWADANLEYDVLRQDTVLPLSYPSTAKTLLTKYGMFDEVDYIARRTSPLAFTDAVPQYPVYQGQCPNQSALKKSVFMVITDQTLHIQQIDKIKQRAKRGLLSLDNHIDNALPKDAWFNLLYSLPSIYKKSLTEQHAQPLLFQIIAQKNLAKSFTIVGEDTTEAAVINSNALLSLTNELFPTTTKLEDISSLIFADKLNSYAPGLHVFYFKGNNSYQFELFLDALMSAQNKKQYDKQNNDILWISSIGNSTIDTSLSIKPALLVLPESKNSAIDKLTSHMDMQPTLIQNWLNCDINAKSYSNGNDIKSLNNDRIIANTMDNGIVVFNKDKSMFVDQNGNFQSYSIQLASPITAKPDFPLMIDGVNFIKQFSKQAHNVQ
ncbi:MAG: membrane-anchored protein YejM (alkaline phosphatase superfamily) [Cognaticolwellia sp.]|jgi:membrane-anchored protein YejM (alkaline phosphatase superfamily)